MDLSKSIEKRIAYAPYVNLVMEASQAAQFIKDKMVVGTSGFTKAGDSKAVLRAFAERARQEPLGITLITGASLGQNTDTLLTEAGALIRRMPFQVDRTLRSALNSGDVAYTDQHLSETVEYIQHGHIAPVDLAVLEACAIDQEGNLYPTTSVGNSWHFAQYAKHIIVEINLSVPLSFKGIHDIFSPGIAPNRQPIEILNAQSRVGTPVIKIDPSKVVGVVFTDSLDSPAEVAKIDENTQSIAQHLLEFFNNEIQQGRLTPSLLPLQAGIGKVANAVMAGLTHGDFKNLTMYSEVLQDSTLDLFDSGKLDFASASSITLSEGYHERLLQNFDTYKDKIVLRPQQISNAPEVIRRLGVIAINTAIEFDIYGNVNSTHISGSNMMNGIGGSGDFARNAYLSIFVCSSASKEENAISHVLPMVTHTDHATHDVDILVTEQGLADLRGLTPREKARVIIAQCAHPDYKHELLNYFESACIRGGQTPHLLEHAFDFHRRLRESGHMLGNEEEQKHANADCKTIL